MSGIIALLRKTNPFGNFCKKSFVCDADWTFDLFFLGLSKYFRENTGHFRVNLSTSDLFESVLIKTIKKIAHGIFFS